MGGPFTLGTVVTLFVVLALKVVPVILMIGGAAWVFTRTEFGRSLRRGGAGNSGDGARLVELEMTVEQLRRELAEVQERQDFTERVLAAASRTLEAAQGDVDTPTPPEVALT